MDVSVLSIDTHLLPEATRASQFQRGILQLWAAARLSWKIEANWTNLYIFSLFSIIKPLASALILIVIYLVGAQAAGGQTIDTAQLRLIVIGAAFYDFWLTGLSAHSQVLLNDRERFETLKYLIIAPLNWYLFVWVRGISRMGLSAVSALVTLCAGLFFFPLPTSHLLGQLPLLLLVLVIGWVGIMALGAMLASLFVLLSWQGGYLGSIFAATLLLVSSVFFPLETLPGWAQGIGQVLPTTLWLEMIRRLLTGTTLSTAFASVSTGQLFLRLVISMGIVYLISIPTLAWCQKELIKRGRVEVRTGA